MLYDYDYYPYRSSYYYSRPRYYTSYVPSYFVGDRYYNSYRYSRPLYITPSYTSYAKIRGYLPRTPLYTPSIDYKYSTYDRATPIARMLSPMYPEALKYDYTYGKDFDSATYDIRSKASQLLDDITTPSTRYTRAVSLEPAYSSDYYTRRAMSRARLMSEEPRTTTITTTRYFHY